MSLFILIIDLLLTIPLSFIIMYIGQKKNNVLNLCIIPTVYILIISALFPSLKLNIFLIPLFELLIRNFYITNIKEDIITDKVFTICGIISILISLFTYNFFISKVDSVVPTPEEIRGILWLLIILFIYNLYKEIKNNNNVSKIKSLENKNEYIVMQYAKFKNLYNKKVNSKIPEVNKLLYSIMIYENYQKPSIYRYITIYINRLLNKPIKYGIMQVPSLLPLSDGETIEVTKKEIEKVLRKDKNIDNYLKKYEIEKQKNIKIIYTEIEKFIKK